MMEKLKVIFIVLTFRMLFFLNLFWSENEWRSALIYLLLGKADRFAPGNLEIELCRLVGAKYALVVNLGRSAIQLALEAYQFPPGSEVILPSFGCTGTVMPVLQAGLKPVFADVDRSFSLSLESVQQALSNKTCAILIPHLSGKFVADTSLLVDLAHQRGIKVIDDACQSFGLVVNGKWAGTFGDVGIFSFGGGKTIFSSGGGALVTNDETVIGYCRGRILPEEKSQSVRARLGRFLWNYGPQPISYPYNALVSRLFTDKNVLHEKLVDFQYPVYAISPIEAALALYQIKRSEDIIRRRKNNAKILLESHILHKLNLVLPDPAEHVFTKFLVASHGDLEWLEKMRTSLFRAGIQTEVSYTPLHMRAPFSNFPRVTLTETERLWKGAFSIPVSPRFGSDEMNRIVDALKRHFKI